VGFILGLIFVLIGEICVFFTILISKIEFLCIFITNFLIYFSLSYCYFHFVNLGETGRRIRILIELYNSKDGLSMEEILKIYNAKIILKKRFTRLVNHGQIKIKNNKYYIVNNSFMLIISKLMVGMKLLLLGKKSEFD